MLLYKKKKKKKKRIHSLNIEQTVTYTFIKNNPCFQCNTAITNVFVSNTCKIRFHDVIGQSTIHSIPTQKF